MLPSRYMALAGAVAALAGALVWWLLWRGTAPLWIGGGALALVLVGVRDLTQAFSNVRRNYPIVAHLRHFFESVRPEIRQYFVESDTEPVPFSRAQRSIVYQRAAGALDLRPFGTLLDVHAQGHEWINHSIAPAHARDHDFRVSIGSAQCAQPYSASVFNISAMSFGSLSPTAILALNEGARRGGFYHDTGEGSISSYHRVHGGDLVWEIGSGYFGCRDAAGRFDPARFREAAASPQVRMIEVKLSQGAKPGHGGILPGAKVTPEIAAARGVPAGEDCVSPAAHPEFSSPVGLLEFIARLRELSGGKPVGFKFALGHPWEWFGIAKAMLATGIAPDFIVVDGSEGGTGAAPLEFTDHVGAPLREALLLVHNTLVGTGMREQIRLGAAGKIVTGFDLARTCALGADWCNAARGFMFAIGCIQAQTCHTGLCPTGVTTQDPRRYGAIVVADKAERVHRFHQNTLMAFRDLLGAAGLSHPDQLGPEHVLRRISTTEVRSLASLYQWVEPGSLRTGDVPEQAVFQKFWTASGIDSFAPPERIAQLRTSKVR